MTTKKCKGEKTPGRLELTRWCQYQPKYATIRNRRGPAELHSKRPAELAFNIGSVRWWLCKLKISGCNTVVSTICQFWKYLEICWQEIYSDICWQESILGSTKTGFGGETVNTEFLGESAWVPLGQPEPWWSSWGEHTACWRGLLGVDWQPVQPLWIFKFLELSVNTWFLCLCCLIS